MKTKIAIALIALLAGFGLGIVSPLHRHLQKAEPRVETRIDTLAYSHPLPKAEATKITQAYTLPKHVVVGSCGGKARCSQASDAATQEQDDDEETSCSEDSVLLELPIVERHYADSTWEAWVSGPVDPRLDSIRVYNRTTTVHVPQTARRKDKHWHVGPTAGVSYGPKGFQPYVGIGITYSLFGF